MRRCWTIVLVGLLVPMAGCVERRLFIDSDPPGALVWLNDAQLGRTPVDVRIVHDGTYDLRLEKEGFEPVVMGARSDGPLLDVVPLDLVVEVLPTDVRYETHWRVAMRPRDDSDEGLLERARQLRGATR